MSSPGYGMKKSDVMLFRLRSLREVMANLDPDDLAEIDRGASELIVKWTASQNIPLFLLDVLVGAIESARAEREAF